MKCVYEKGNFICESRFENIFQIWNRKTLVSGLECATPRTGSDSSSRRKYPCNQTGDVTVGRNIVSRIRILGTVFPHGV